ncbi:hypothetical protein [Erwinia sp. QL-Z3]|uniref:hypothetical protein n=1 Tax=Erwinia sp. QL-Z3 TaxID=2547962 RepID=UPI0010710B17|nr:hypothetical protein [Erwinia sp. QL-Z3]QBR52646.1 hypothetical protein E2F51_22930 [Erwinia sp. QL-Z3]
MSVRGKDFLEFANRCVDEGSEIGYRNAMGRAYYGVYHEVSCILEKAIFVHTHQSIRDYLTTTSWLKGNEPFEKMKLIALGSRLKQMHTKRVAADYDLLETFNEVDARAVLVQAEKFMEVMDEMYEKVYPKSPAA